MCISPGEDGKCHQECGPAQGNNSPPGRRQVWMWICHRPCWVHGNDVGTIIVPYVKETSGLITLSSLLAIN